MNKERKKKRQIGKKKDRKKERIYDWKKERKTERKNYRMWSGQKGEKNKWFLTFTNRQEIVLKFLTWKTKEKKVKIYLFQSWMVLRKTIF